MENAVGNVDVLGPGDFATVIKAAAVFSGDPILDGAVLWSDRCEVNVAPKEAQNDNRYAERAQALLDVATLHCAQKLAAKLLAQLP